MVMVSFAFGAAARRGSAQVTDPRRHRRRAVPIRGASMDTVASRDLGLGIVENTPALHRYARSLTRSADQAEDLVQDCITRALDRQHLYRPDTNLRAWLFTILYNIFIGQHRKAIHQRSYARERMMLGAAFTPPSQFHTVALKESLLLLETMPARERQVIALLGIFEMTYVEAARHSGIELGTVKSRASRSRARLRLLALRAGSVGAETPAGDGHPTRVRRHRAA
jgi:RNA polymerase sigma-70 factor (ECF subfamily)